MADEIVCRACKFWQKHVHMGVCKRFPLVHNKSETDWCGEFMAKVIPAAPEVIPEVIEPVVMPKKLGRPRKVA